MNPHDQGAPVEPHPLPPLLTLTAMRRLLDDHGVQLTKSLGQNFLHDGNQLARIVAAAGVAPGSRVLEVGPGLGPLTERLLAAGGRVLAIEKDARVAELLRQRLGGQPALELKVADAVRWISDTPRDWSGWTLAANLPYSVGSVLLIELALAEAPPDRMTVTLQKEVADRLAAGPGGKDYGLLTVLAALQFQPAGRFVIAASCFFPTPAVGSACITLERRREPLVSRALARVYCEAAKLAFSQRRKMAAKLLRSRWPAETVAAAMERAGVGPDARAETMAPETFAALAQGLGADEPAEAAGSPPPKEAEAD